MVTKRQLGNEQIEIRIVIFMKPEKAILSLS